MLFAFLRCLSSDWLLHKCLPQRSVPPCGVHGSGEEHISRFQISSFSKRPFQRRIPLLAGGDGGACKPASAEPGGPRFGAHGLLRRFTFSQAALTLGTLQPEDSPAILTQLPTRSRQTLDVSLLTRSCVFYRSSLDAKLS